MVLLDASYLVECANLSKATAMDSSCTVNQPGSLEFVREVSEEIKLWRKKGSKFECVLYFLVRYYLIFIFGAMAA